MTAAYHSLMRVTLEDAWLWLAVTLGVGGIAVTAIGGVMAEVSPSMERGNVVCVRDFDGLPIGGPDEFDPPLCPAGSHAALFDDEGMRNDSLLFPHEAVPSASTASVGKLGDALLWAGLLMMSTCLVLLLAYEFVAPRLGRRSVERR